MGDDNHGDPAVREGFHHKQHFANHFRVECRRRLVKENDLRRRGQSTGNRHALLLSAGKFSGEAVRLLQHADLLQQRQRALLGGQGFPAVNVLQCQGDVLTGGKVGIEIELLEHKPDAAA